MRTGEAPVARSGVAAVTGVFALVLGVSACGAHQGSGTPDQTARTKASAKAARTLSTADLKALTFHDGEVPQAWEGAIDVTVRDDTADADTFPPVSDPDCQRVLDISDGENAPAVVDQIFNWKGDIYPGGSTLAAYKGAVAEQAFDRLRNELKSCRSFSGTGFVGKYHSKLVLGSPPHVGDQALSFRIESPIDGRIRNDQYVVIRVGTTIATYTARNVNKPASFPFELIEKQVTRLRNAQRS
ncbi:hypothetical protein [Streptomyces sp. 142MFCol3.1]|uniref:hypothetical protein n=1 Tax=Streptomyces sp. 142MFCol3.1 TaxID=1172179 RepID=UPI0003FC46C3|nr:hypothetical protein [Streptomyces sp. 142MFCol3.1]